MSPPTGCATLITRAPRSASVIVQYGPARTRDRSRTRTPSSGAEGSVGFIGSRDAKRSGEFRQARREGEPTASGGRRRRGGRLRGVNIVIVGFGRVGSATVRELREDGHSVVLIEQRGDRIDRATRVEGLRTVRGNAIDADVQLRAGVDRADVFLALTREDTVNLVAAEVAKKRFSVPHAIARIYIPSRASIFEALGIRTICPTLYTVDAIRTTVRDIQGLPAAPRPPAETARPKARRPPALDESKFVLISGGGKIGSGLARTLAGRG